jgi:hypothetical protein
MSSRASRRTKRPTRRSSRANAETCPACAELRSLACAYLEAHPDTEALAVTAIGNEALISPVTRDWINEQRTEIGREPIDFGALPGRTIALIQTEHGSQWLAVALVRNARETSYDPN